MNGTVKIVECPRDAWQGLPVHIPSQQKADYLHALIAAGFKHIDAVSFVSPKAIPQMADSEAVLQQLEVPGGVEIIGIVVNEKGAQRGIATKKVHTLGFPYSISPGFLRRNQNQSPEESLLALQSIAILAHDAGLHVVAYVSMAFGNPYGDPWSAELVREACDQLVESGIRQISLADTVGLATPTQVEETVASSIAALPDVEIGVHLHASAQAAPAKIHAAWRAGCRRYDAAIGGLGGCPLAQDDLVGNISTETLLAKLQAVGGELPPLQPLEAILHANAGISFQFGQAETMPTETTEDTF
jgi:hydroxymethylglutaryl-CoA lyase